MKFIQCSLTIVLSVSATNVFSYEFPTHNDLSRAAFIKSRLNLDPNLLASMGILNPGATYMVTDGPTLPNFTAPCARRAKFNVQQLIGCGAQFEDAPNTAVFNHFFDPYYDTALSVPGVQTWRSPDWALEDKQNISGQNYSYKDARQAFYDALTIAGAQDARDARWGRVFQNIGQIVHHLQDMMQPQHVRSDPHLSLPVPFITNPSLLEHYTEDHRPEAKTIMEGPGSDAIFPGNGARVFLTPRDFWVNSSKSGLAERGNRDFLSAGTNFEIDNDGITSNPRAYPSPTFGGFGTPIPANQLLPPPPQQTLDECGTCPVTFATTNATITNPQDVRASALSIFDQYVDRRPISYGPTYPLDYQTNRVFTLNKYTIIASQSRLLPLAVSYSAGLINYFFRGKMEISLPDEGVYGIVDHAAPEGNTKDTGGFFKIKLKLKNVTPDAEKMSALGKIILVAKFHRNTCYQADLSGEYGAPGINFQECRTKDEEILTSNAQTAPDGLETAPRQVEFNFSSPIPINATDLYLQVVYRGPLGAETDAVVVETKDISEPTYRYHYTPRDQYMYAHYPIVSDGPYTFAEWCMQGYSALDDCKYSEGLTYTQQHRPDSGPFAGYTDSPYERAVWYGQLTYPKAPFPQLYKMGARVGDLSRIAFLTDAQPTNWAMWTVDWISTDPSATWLWMWNSGMPIANINQVNPMDNTLESTYTYVKARGFYFPTELAEDLNRHTAPANLIPDLILVKSQVNF